MSLVVLTRDLRGNAAWAEALGAAGCETYSLPCIRIEPIEAAPLRDSYDLLVLTSANAARNIQGVRAPVAAIGVETASAAEEQGFRIAFVAGTPTAKALAEQLPEPAGKRLLFARAQGANSPLAAILRARGARVDELAVYRTVAYTTPDPRFEAILFSGTPLAITFASPSAVAGFAGRISKPALQVARRLPAIATGAKTGRAVSRAGFHRLTVAGPDISSLITSVRNI